MSEENSGQWLGYPHAECTEHRPLSSDRSWCYDCSEKCTRNAPCARCELGELHHLGFGFPDPP